MRRVLLEDLNIRSTLLVLVIKLLTEKEIYEQISRTLNQVGEIRLAREFVSSLKRDHPSLQQAFWRFVLNVSKEYPNNLHSDMRNQASVDLTKRINQMVEEENLFLPLI